MNRLLAELERLYGWDRHAHLPNDSRVAVLAVVLPAGWHELSPVWRGVQSDLALPAPAIAVSGVDTLQLWFSFAAPISSAASTRFMRGLRERYLAGVATSQVRAFTKAADIPAAPCIETGPQRWSAFVAHDLASLFAETPWLDIPPTDAGQAALLRALEPTGLAAFEDALNTLCTSDDGAPPDPPASEGAAPAASAIAGPHETDPARFLASVMNDATAPLALRIEAAKILLASANAP